MSYLNIKEAIEYTGKSNSTLRNHLRTLKASGNKTFNGKEILSYKLLKNNSKQIFILKDYLDSVYNADKSNNIQTDTQITSDSTSLIEALKDHITTLKEELSNRNKQIDDFLILEQRAMERIQEQNHIIHQLNTIIDEKQKVIESKSNNTVKQSFTEDIESVESLDEQEDLTEQTQNLAKHRQDVLKSEMSKNQDIYEWLEQNSFNRRKDD